MLDRKLIEHYLESLKQPRAPLSDWETDFLISVTDQWHHRGTLSGKQLDILTRLYEDKT